MENNLDSISYLQTHRRWKLDRRGVLNTSVSQALATACNAAPHLSDLSHQIIEVLPNKVFVSDNIKCVGNPNSWSELITHAIFRPWISFNNEQFCNAITLDCDHDDLDLVEDIVRSGCPRPLVVVDPATGRYHATWLLSDPVAVTIDDHIGPRRALAYARALLTDALKADKAYTGRLTRNPFALKTALSGPIRRRPETMYADYVVAAWKSEPLVWAVAMLPEPCRLGEIIAALADDFEPVWPNRTQKVETVHAEEGRNCTLFRTIAEWARKTYAAYDCDFNELMSVAESVNSSFPELLDEKEVKCIVRSVYRWMKTKWRGRGDSKNRGAMTRDGSINNDMMLDEKQQKSGPWSRDKAMRNNDVKISDAIDRLSAASAKITQVALAKEAGVSERTIRSRWPKIRQQGVYHVLPEAVAVNQNLPETSDHLESRGFLTSSPPDVDKTPLEVSLGIDGIKSNADVDNNIIAISLLNDVISSPDIYKDVISHNANDSTKLSVGHVDDVIYRYSVSSDLSEIHSVYDDHEIEDGYALTVEIIRGRVSFKPDPRMRLTEHLKFRIAMLVKDIRVQRIDRLAA